MLRFIFPTIMLAAAIGLFVVFTNPAYQDIGTLRVQQGAYDQALNNSQELLKVRDNLTNIYNNMSTTQRDAISKIMPDNVDNIRLIIDIQNVALKYGMNPTDIKYDANATGAAAGTAPAAVTPAQLANTQKSYGTFELEFSVTGSYSNFLSFITDLEHSLRMIDIESVTFQAPNVGSSAIKYDIRVKTYWLKS